MAELQGKVCVEEAPHVPVRVSLQGKENMRRTDPYRRAEKALPIQRARRATRSTRLPCQDATKQAAEVGGDLLDPTSTDALPDYLLQRKHQRLLTALIALEERRLERAIAIAGHSQSRIPALGVPTRVVSVRL